MDNTKYDHIFKKSIIPFLKDIRSIQDPEQQKATFVENYKLVLAFLREYLGAAWLKDRKSYEWAFTQDYMDDFRSLGYDISYETVIGNNIPDRTERDRKDNTSWENSYTFFTSGTSWWVEGEQKNTRDKFMKYTDPNNNEGGVVSNDSRFQRAA